MDTDQIFKYCLDINKKVLNELINTYDGNFSSKETRLLIPTYRNASKRLSEQELRFAFVAYLEKVTDEELKLFYTVETPTEQKYSSTGANERSALSDLSLYELCDNQPEKVCNIEFKAHNAKYDSIKKDIEKMCRENTPYLWFHLLKNEDADTVKALLGKFIKAFEEMAFKSLLPKEPLLFSILIVKSQTILVREILNPEDLENPGNIFKLAYSDYEKLPKKEEHNINEWRIIKV